jgi:hypothetical protein
MRSIIGILGGIVTLFVGYLGLSEAAQQSQDAAVTNGTNASASAYNATNAVVDGIGQAASPAVVWMGIGAIILVALAVLVTAGSSGR